MDNSSTSTFECKHCGACCSNMDDLALFEWEKDRLSKDKSIKGIKIRPAIVVRLGKARVILQWGLKNKNGKCPFRSNDRCKIYSKRPLVCRSFPFMTSGIHTVDKMLSKECPNLKLPTVKGVVRKEEFLNELSRAYGKSFDSVQKLDAARMWVGDLSVYVARLLGERVDSFKDEEIGLLALCLREGIYDKRTLDREVKFFMK